MPAEPPVDLDVVHAAVRAATGPEQSFVLLWSWVNTTVQACENVLAAAGLALADVRAEPWPIVSDVGVPRATKVLQALGHLRYLDDQLGQATTARLAAGCHRDLEGHEWRIVRAEIAPMVSNLRRGAADKWGNDIRAHAKTHTLVAIDDASVAINVKLLDHTDVGVSLADAAAGGRLRIQPLETELTIAGPPWSVGVVDTDGSRAACRAVIGQAAHDRVDVLVLSELSIEAGVVEGPDGVRAETGGEHPILVVVGLTHHERDGAPTNRAITVDRWGNVVHEHVKMTRFNDDASWEVHQTGDRLVVAPSPWGLITTPICRDLFDPATRQRLEASRSTLTLCPSLSPKIAEHRDAAAVLRQANRAVTVVANRWGINDAPMNPDMGPSFALIPGDQPEIRSSVAGVPIDLTWGTA